MPKRVWKDTFYVKAYELSRTGASDNKIAEGLGVSIGILRKWMKANKAFRIAITKGRKVRGGAATNDFRNFVYNTLPDNLRKLWKRIMMLHENEGSIAMIEELLANEGKAARQHLFCYALTSGNYSVAEACRKVNIPRSTFDTWCEYDADFAEMIRQIHVAKQDFVEGALIDQIADGDPSCIIFASRTLNRDRGYDDKQKVEVSGTVQHRHAVISIDALLPDLSIELKRELLNAMRVKKAEVIESTVVPRLKASS